MTEFDAIHGRLRQIRLDAADGLAIVTDEPGNLVIHDTGVDERTGKPRWFGTVTTRKGYVAYHLIPLYEHPALTDDLSNALSKRRQAPGRRRSSCAGSCASSPPDGRGSAISSP